ncbi:hypothetical protein [Nocardiopsis trehalosi]|jgi:hypothetical protein|uniref:hypothetical protein n=1 Tax=Nocardiopsis trehalosi TaxID=109329 RepID=UPI000B1014E8|nr:hypothetical protein [Nocardiopsis trehalosi]
MSTVLGRGADAASFHAGLEDAGRPGLADFTLEVPADRRTHRVRARGLGPWEHRR